MQASSWESRGKQKLYQELVWNHLCDILFKNLASFCLCPENLSEVEIEDNGLICLAEEISRQEGIQDDAEKAAIIVKKIRTTEDPIHSKGESLNWYRRDSQFFRTSCLRKGFPRHHTTVVQEVQDTCQSGSRAWQWYPVVVVFKAWKMWLRGSWVLQQF